MIIWEMGNCSLNEAAPVVQAAPYGHAEAGPEALQGCPPCSRCHILRPGRVRRGM